MLPINEKEVQIDLTAAAFEQIRLILENDYTLEGHYFRLKIDGKGCDGFTYSTGFSTEYPEDTKLVYEYKTQQICMLIDKFTLFYCQEGYLDFLVRPKENEDGFIFINSNEEKYHGKFFKDGDLVPASLAKD